MVGHVWWRFEAIMLLSISLSVTGHSQGQNISVFITTCNLLVATPCPAKAGCRSLQLPTGHRCFSTTPYFEDTKGFGGFVAPQYHLCSCSRAVLTQCHSTP